MKNFVIICSSLLCSTIFCAAQSNPFLNFDTDKILQRDDNIPEILLVGSFHFAYYGLDGHVTKEENKYPILSPKGQKDVEELVAYIEQFKPTKIMVESGKNTGFLMRRYEDYLKNPKSLKANEIDQIGFRLMKKFNIDTLYGVDDYGLNGDLANHQDSMVTRPILEDIFEGWDYRSEEKYSKRYSEWYDKEEEMALQSSLLNYFKYMNSDHSLNRGWGAYLVGDFMTEDHSGPDALAISWYSRNLRILRNIQKNTEPQDRILIIFGAGHMTILKNLFESTPQYNLVKFGDLKG